MDPRMENFILTPDNAFIVSPYTAEFNEGKAGPGGIEERDETLLYLAD